MHVWVVTFAHEHACDRLGKQVQQMLSDKSHYWADSNNLRLRNCQAKALMRSDQTPHHRK